MARAECQFEAGSRDDLKDEANLCGGFSSFEFGEKPNTDADDVCEFSLRQSLVFAGVTHGVADGLNVVDDDGLRWVLVGVGHKFVFPYRINSSQLVRSIARLSRTGKYTRKWGLKWGSFPDQEKEMAVAGGWGPVSGKVNGGTAKGVSNPARGYRGFAP